jgi:hypothetical protein
MSVSNVHERVTPEYEVSLSGSGIILYPPLDPQGFLGATVFVIESDQKTRDIGKLLGDLFQDQKVSGAINALINAAAPSNPLVAAVLGAIVEVVPKILAKNKDDVLLVHSHSGFDFDHYGIGFDGTAPSSDFKIGNHRAFATLRVVEIP